jgi:hypothetical protein
MNAPAPPPFPPNPTFGQFFGNWVWSGSRWVCTNTNGVRIVTQVFRASAPYMPSPGLISLIVNTIGGGGGGGDAYSASGQGIFIGGGGGSGGWSRIALASGLVAGGVNVIIGAGGPGGGAPGNPGGGSGGVTSFGAFCVANGGLGGANNDGGVTPGANGAPGAPAAPGVGDIAWPGSQGFVGPIILGTTLQSVPGGLGGQLISGAVTADIGSAAQVAGVDAYPNTGAGGSGAVNNQFTAPTAGAGGGAGGSGLCWVDEYCWADAFDTGCGCGPTGGARVAITSVPQGRGGWSGQGGWDND